MRQFFPSQEFIKLFFNITVTMVTWSTSGHLKCLWLSLPLSLFLTLSHSSVLWMTIMSYSQVWILLADHVLWRFQKRSNGSGSFSVLCARVCVQYNILQTGSTAPKIQVIKQSGSHTINQYLARRNQHSLWLCVSLCVSAKHVWAEASKTTWNKEEQWCVSI